MVPNPILSVEKMVHISKVQSKGRGGPSTQVSPARSMAQQLQQPMGHLRDEVGIGSDDSTQAPEKMIEESNEATKAQANVEEVNDGKVYFN